MNLNNKYLQLPKEMRESFFEDATRVHVSGRLNVTEFENEFKKTMRGEALTGEKALHMAMQVPPRPLPSIQSLLQLPERT
jgi:hypothetical protein